jgi:hypothetical protein
LTQSGNETKFAVDIDADDDFVEMFRQMWPKALVLLKKVAERKE